MSVTSDEEGPFVARTHYRGEKLKTPARANWPVFENRKNPPAATVCPWSSRIVSPRAPRLGRASYENPPKSFGASFWLSGEARMRLGFVAGPRRRALVHSADAGAGPTTQLR
jgi:hypothetical protein